MNNNQLEKGVAAYYPVYILERLLPISIRNRLRKIFYNIFIISLVISLCERLVSIFPNTFKGNIPIVSEYLYNIHGLLVLSLAFFIVFIFLEVFSRSVVASIEKIGVKVSFALATVVMQSERHEPVRSFLSSSFGRELMYRLNIPQDKLKAFLRLRRKLPPAEANWLEANITNCGMLAEFLIEKDKELEQFLLSNGVKAKDFVGASRWLEKIIRAERESRRWWSRENLGRIPGVGKDWSFGHAYRLERYAQKINKNRVFADAGDQVALYEDEATKIESILARQSQANALVIASTLTEGLSSVAVVALRLSEGLVYPELEHKKMYVLDGVALVSMMKDKVSFENELRGIFDDAIKAGDIILVIKDLPAMIESAHAINADVVSILESYLASSLIQCLAISESVRFHETVETNPTLVSLFEKVLVTYNEKESLIRYVESEAEDHEKKFPIRFTYQAIVAIAEGADRFAQGALADKASDIILELVPSLVRKGILIVTKDDVLAFLEEKTGVPQGKVTQEEKIKLVNIEGELHKRIVGQEEAIKSISSSLRRSRAGIGNPRKPIGTFLFLGPTGVGKTETTKALASYYFGGEDKMMRLDMSEYRTADAMTRLIGNFSENKAGVLSTMIREKPYGVLLLDEFEKTYPEVLDLFLQILDEGYFSDMLGQRVSCRNLIIIATSNAGSPLIWDYVHNGENPVLKKDEIISHIIREKIFKPELLNRFDATIIFEPLGKKELRTIAGFMLVKLADRLKEQGFGLSVGQDIVDYLVEKGTDPTFGARAMNRAIQEVLEERIARQIIQGQISEGDTIQISKENL